MTLHEKDSSTKSVLIVMAAQLEESAAKYDSHGYHPSSARRSEAMRTTAKKLRTLANSRAVQTMLDYME